MKTITLTEREYALVKCVVARAAMLMRDGVIPPDQARWLSSECLGREDTVMITELDSLSERIYAEGRQKEETK